MLGDHQPLGEDIGLSGVKSVAGRATEPNLDVSDTEKIITSRC